MTDIQTTLYQLEHFADGLVTAQLTQISWVSIVTIFAAGLLTSLTPCTLSMLPITIGYIGGYESKSRWEAALQSTFFCGGIATTLAGLGIFAAVVGKVYGQIGLGLPIFVSIGHTVFFTRMCIYGVFIPYITPLKTWIGWQVAEPTL